LVHPLSQPQSIALRIQKKNGVAATRVDSSPMRETPLSFRDATAVGRAALCC
jgi:hypothetical protein